MRRHTIDIVFSLSLFMIFVICSFLLLLFQINGYHGLQYDSDNLLTASAFLKTEIHRSDNKDQIQVVDIQDTVCLQIQHRDDVTYYYVRDGYLMELYLDKKVTVDLSLGEKRFSSERMTMTLDDGVLTMTLSKEEEQIQLHLRLRSGGMAL